MNIKVFIRNSNKEFINILFRLRDTTVDLHYKSDIIISPEDWDLKNNCIKKPSGNTMGFEKKRLIEFTDRIDERKKLIRDIFLNHPNPELLTSELLTIAIDKQLHPDKYLTVSESTHPNTLLSYIANFIEIAPFRKDKITGRLLSNNSTQQYKGTQKHVVAFSKIEHKKEYLFSEIDINFYNRFVEYLQNPIITKDKSGKETVIKKAFTQNSVGKYIKILKMMINESNSTESDISNFHVFTEEVDNVYLNEDELQKLKDCDLSKNHHLDRVRDWFLLLCWTGCRFSDLSKITKTDIKDKFITFRQQKTNAKVTIPLHPIVLDILKKYDFEMPSPITNQKFNDYIKEVSQLAGIDEKETFTRTSGGKLVNETKPKFELITSHTGRRSFCTNMYKRGLPTLMIMSISGHKTEKSFLKYIKVKQDEHAAMMSEKWAEMYKPI